MKIPFVDLAVSEGTEAYRLYMAAVSSVLESGSFVLGAALERFEQALADFAGTAYCVGLNSGTDALFLSLKALGVGAGDEVVLPGNVFAGVAGAVMMTGAVPVFCDVSYETMLVEVDTLEPCVTGRTKAVIPVHLTGAPCDMAPIVDFCRDRNIAVIEDAAQALGALYNGKRAGSLGDAGCFSFHPLKNIHALGDGGALVTNDKKLYETLMKLRNHGLEDGLVRMPGYNSRLDDIHAAVLQDQLESVETITQKKREMAAIYSRSLRGTVGINEERPGSEGVYQLYMIKTDTRDRLKDYLAGKGIETRIHYTCYVPFHPYYRKTFGEFHLPVTERLAKEVLSLPIGLSMTQTDVDDVVNEIHSFFRRL